MIQIGLSLPCPQFCIGPAVERACKRRETVPTDLSLPGGSTTTNACQIHLPLRQRCDRLTAVVFCVCVAQR